MFERLLLPLDGSSLAEAALPVAEGIARAMGSTVTLLHVIERRPPTQVHGERHLTDAERASDYLGQVQRVLAERGLAALVHVHTVPEGDVARSIAEHAGEERADLVVLCTHGSGGVRGLLFGSIAQQVLQRGEAPILLVRPLADGTAAPFAPRTILVALDGTAAAEAALTPAQVLAARLGALLHLVLVVPTAGTLRGERSAAATLLPSATRQLLEVEQEQAQAYLEGQAADVRARGIAAEVEVRRGDISGQLTDDAAEHDADLVITATHGRAGLPALWSGSVASRLIAQASAPVLLLRRQDRD